MKDYEAHVRDARKDREDFSICGEHSYDFMFESIDHAYWAIKNHGRLIPCKKCSKEIFKTFSEVGKLCKNSPHSE